MVGDRAQRGQSPRAPGITRVHRGEPALDRGEVVVGERSVCCQSRALVREHRHKADRDAIDLAVDRRGVVVAWRDAQQSRRERLDQGRTRGVSGAPGIRGRDACQRHSVDPRHLDPALAAQAIAAAGRGLWAPPRAHRHRHLAARDRLDLCVSEEHGGSLRAGRPRAPYAAAMLLKRPRRLAFLVPVAAQLLLACGGGAGVPTQTGIVRATPVVTARPATSATAAAPTIATPVAGAAAFAPWADALCEATARFDDAIATIQDGVDPTTLGLPERIERAQRRYAAYRDALFEELLAVDAITTLPAAEPYHAALRTQVYELDRLFGEQIDQLDRVVLASEIDALTATLQNEVTKLENSLALVRSLLPDGAIAALNAPVRCGEILG